MLYEEVQSKKWILDLDDKGLNLVNHHKYSMLK